jgi:DHA3 family macrolide efflux protein-like MFS transporter
MIAGFAPMIALTPVAGVYVDRSSRKMVIGVVDFLQALSTVFLILLFWSGIASIWTILLLLAFRSACQAFHLPAVQAIIPLMVPRDKLSRLNGLNYLLNGVMTFIGPIVAAVLLTFLAIDQILWVDPATFIIALIPLLLMRIPSVKTEHEKSSFKKAFVEGLSFIRKTRGMVPVIAMATVLNFLIMPLATLLPYYIKYDHLGGAAELAIVMAASQAGMFIGGAVMLALKELKRKMVVILVTLLTSFVGYALVGLTPLGWFWFMAVGAFVLDFFVAPTNISFRTILQVAIPAEMQGRVNSVTMALATAASPLGMIVSGALASYTGTANLFLGCAATGTLVLLLFWFFTDMRYVEEAKQASPNQSQQV